MEFHFAVELLYSRVDEMFKAEIRFHLPLDESTGYLDKNLCRLNCPFMGEILKPNWGCFDPDKDYRYTAINLADANLKQLEKRVYEEALAIEKNFEKLIKENALPSNRFVKGVVYVDITES